MIMKRAKAWLDFNWPVFLVISPSTDGQEETGIHQEQAVPQEGQETDQEVFIESPPPKEALWMREWKNL